MYVHLRFECYYYNDTKGTEEWNLQLCKPDFQSEGSVMQLLPNSLPVLVSNMHVSKNIIELQHIAISN